MAEDPYALLGVEKTASEAEIRKAYRKLAKDLHPDLHPGDTTSEERFKQVSAAYHLLSDSEQRARFDRGEIDASGAERPEQQFYRRYADADRGGRYSSSAGHEDFVDLSDVFSDLFGERAAQGGFRAQGGDQRYHLSVDFLDAVMGAKRRITMPDGKALDLTIPAGLKDGAILRLKGKGGTGFGGGPAGDALVEIAVDRHPFFTREGDDILLELPISLDEAVLGGKIKVPTVSGRLRVTVPKGSSTGNVLRLKGRGVQPKGRPPGDQRVTLKIVLPDRIDPDLEAFMRDWRQRHGYDPRKEMEIGS